MKNKIKHDESSKALVFKESLTPKHHKNIDTHQDEILLSIRALNRIRFIP